MKGRHGTEWNGRFWRRCEFSIPCLRLELGGDMAMLCRREWISWKNNFVTAKGSPCCRVFLKVYRDGFEATTAHESNYGTEIEGLTR